jgi:transposase
MLGPLASPPKPPAGAIPVPPRRGAQPRNSNARTHGMYSSFSPSTLAGISGRFAILSFLARSAPQPQLLSNPVAASVLGVEPTDPDPLLNALAKLHASVFSLVQQAAAKDDLPLLLVSSRLSARISRSECRRILAHQEPLAEIEKAALASLILPVWQFTGYYGIVRDVAQGDFPSPLSTPRHPRSDPVDEGAGQAIGRARAPRAPAAHSFRADSQESGQKTIAIPPDVARLPCMDAHRETQFQPLDMASFLQPAKVARHIDSPHACGWFSDAQWQLIAPLLPADDRNKVRGRPSTSSRLLISVILWKLSHAASWDDLPPSFPARRTCRRYYKRWFLSGLLLTVYKVLMRDLLTRGRVHPYDFVRQGYFRLGSDHRIRQTALCPDTWQTRTALLFVQQSYALIRRIRREAGDPCFPSALLYRKLREHYLDLRLGRSGERPFPGGGRAKRQAGERASSEHRPSLRQAAQGQVAVAHPAPRRRGV